MIRRAIVSGLRRLFRLSPDLEALALQASQENYYQDLLTTSAKMRASALKEIDERLEEIEHEEGPPPEDDEDDPTHGCSCVTCEEERAEERRKRER